MRHLRAARIPFARFDADGGEIEGMERTQGIGCQKGDVLEESRVP
jgi:hypothetical protein